jgi:hypothetical protein
MSKVDLDEIADLSDEPRTKESFVRKAIRVSLKAEKHIQNCAKFFAETYRENLKRRQE